MEIDKCLEDLKHEKLMPERVLCSLCEKVKEILMEEPNVVHVQAPVTVCGDLHGQFHDLLHLFTTGGEIPHTSYVFMGDYVDRGFYSAETIEYLLCLKIKYPSRITLLRGNHESRLITYTYGCYDEITRKYGNSNPWKYLTELFDCLPLAAVVDGKVFCVHAGLSPEISAIDQINTIERRMEVPNIGAFADLLWSDPSVDIDYWGRNGRGAGFVFGEKVVREFNHINKLKLVARSHQLVHDGFEYLFKKQLVTVWSVPNYCYRCGNVAAVMAVSEGSEEPKFSIFESVSDRKLLKPISTVVPYFL